MSDHHIAWPEDTELVLEPKQSGRVGYYFADHVNQVVFWLEKHDIACNIKYVKVELRESHISKYTEAQSPVHVFNIPPIGHLIQHYYW